MVSLFENVKVVKILDPISKNATWNGAGVDRLSYADCILVCHVGVGATPLSGTVYYTLTFEESDTSNSTGFTTIADADIDGGLTGTKVVNSNAKDEQVIVRGYRGAKRWVRITATLTGSDSGSTIFSALAVLGNPTNIPTTPVTEV